MAAMRKKASRKQTRETKTDNFIGADVTIDDFANTLRIRARFKKSVTNISNEVKQKTTKQEEKQAWDETDEEILSKNNIKERRNRRKSKYQMDNDENKGIDYPLDLWFIISEYIQPEAVGKFARICKSSYYVTTTAKFWFHLYKSYYKFVSNLPERLQPQCMRLHGLRACVIRALHYSYFRSEEKNDTIYPQCCMEEPHSLVKRECILMWHRSEKSRWVFYFKLKEVSKTHSSLFKQYDGKDIGFRDTLEDVTINPEDGCKVLRVSCLRYSMLPPVIGLILQTVSVKLMPSHGFREEKLHLEFGTSDVPSTLTNQEIILRKVTGYSVLNWWDPSYPHQDMGYRIELPQSDAWD